MIYPDAPQCPPPHKDMPTDVCQDYNEAASIAHLSPKAAAALLRLALQKLLMIVGGNGENINTDIRDLAAKGVLPPTVVKVADTLRITGNNAVHPGKMADDDLDELSGKLFELINFIIHKTITEPKELEALYNMTPEGTRSAAEAQDARNQS